ncbi:putative quinol monooxygenase [Aeromonas veronii]
MSRYSKSTVRRHRRVSHFEVEFADNHIQLTRAETGCLIFKVTQDPLNPCRFDVYEEFVDQAAFQAHQARVKSSRWRKITVNVERHYTVTGIA